MTPPRPCHHLPAAERVRALMRLREAWLNPSFPFRRRALSFLRRELWGKNEAKASLDLPLGGISSRGLKAYLAQDDPGRGLTVGAVLAGNLPAVFLFLFFRAAVCGAGLFVKPSRHDPVFPQLFQESLATVAPELKESLVVSYWKGGSTQDRRMARACDGLVVFGGDEATQAWRKIAREKPLVCFGHRYSIAVTDAESVAKESRWASRLAFDATLYGQQGCFSPQALFLRASRGQAKRAAETLFAAMRRVRRRLGARLTADEAILLELTRRKYADLQAAGAPVALWAGDEPSPLVILDDTNLPMPFTGSGVLYVRTFRRLAELDELLTLQGERLSCVGCLPATLGSYAAQAGRTAGQERLQRLLVSHGAYRFVPFGSMQRDRIEDLHEGVPIFRRLARQA